MPSTDSITQILLHALAPYSELSSYWMTHKLPQKYIANHATFPIRTRKIIVQICGRFWVTQYVHGISFVILYSKIVRHPMMNIYVYKIGGP